MTEHDDRNFDEVAAIVVGWMRAHDFSDAELTPDAGGGLYDVESERAIAEINVGAPPSRPHVQRLDQAARSVNRRALYFSVRGFTTSAEEWADNVNIALFEFDKDGEDVSPVNPLAEKLCQAPPSREEQLLAAASRAVASVKVELHDEGMLRDTDDDTAQRIREAREHKKMRRNLFG